MKAFQGNYYSSLNSPDFYDTELALRTSRCYGGTMAMWLKEHDPYVSILHVSSSSFLPLMFSPPGQLPTVHIAVYLPTAGKDSKFIEELAKLDACINDLDERFPEASLFLRGDFNVNRNNLSRTGLLNYFSSNQNLQSVNIPHTTYHHFTGGGAHDSHLDQIFYSKETGCLENLSVIYCKLEHPLIDSHHDLIVSSATIPLQLAPALEASLANVVAPRVINKRTKVLWSTTGISEYEKMVAPLLQLIQDVWLSSPTPSRSVLALCVQSTNRVLALSAKTTNKTIDLSKQHEQKSSPMSKKVKASQKHIMKLHKTLGNTTVPQANHDLKKELKINKQEHRRLIRSENAAESCKRDAALFSILQNNPSDIFKSIRSSKSNNLRNISKLSANGKIYAGDNVPDGFYDSLLDLKTFYPESIQDSSSYERHLSDYEHIIEICRSGSKMPSISREVSSEILERIRPDVNDYNSVTANHFLKAGQAGHAHFHLLLNSLIKDINNITLEEINTVHAAILFKGHSKDRGSARSYRTISTCPLVAKALDIFVPDLNIDCWDSNQAPTQFLGSGSSHELAALIRPGYNSRLSWILR